MGKIKHIKTTIDNITFDSKTEANYYQYIKDNKEALNIKKFELQPEFILQEKHMIINNQIVVPKDDKELRKLQKQHPGCTVQPIKYIADFLITYNDGTDNILPVTNIQPSDKILVNKTFSLTGTNTATGMATGDGLVMPYKVGLKYKSTFKFLGKTLL